MYSCVHWQCVQLYMAMRTYHGSSLRRYRPVDSVNLHRSEAISKTQYKNLGRPLTPAMPSKKRLRYSDGVSRTRAVVLFAPRVTHLSPQVSPRKPATTA